MYIQIDLSVYNPDDRVEYELWYSTVLDLPQQFVAEIGQYQKPFGTDALFTPRIISFSCPGCPPSIREEYCLSDGEYCAYQAQFHDSYLPSEQNQPWIIRNETGDIDTRLKFVSQNTSSLDLLYESLREKCLYLNQLEEDKSMVFEKWFKYINFVN